MDITDKLTSIIMENTGHKYKVKPDTDLYTEINVDSFSRLMIINAIEDEFSIEIDEDDIEKFTTVNEIADVLKAKYIK